MGSMCHNLTDAYHVADKACHFGADSQLAMLPIFASVARYDIRF